jgi:hypothetical protein
MNDQRPVRPRYTSESLRGTEALPPPYPPPQAGEGREGGGLGTRSATDRRACSRDSGRAWITESARPPLTETVPRD